MPDSARSRNMAAIRGKDTRPELIVRRFLHARGLRFRLYAKGLPGKPDIVFRPKRAAVFVHGCFWHGCPHCRSGRREVKSNTGYWKPKLAKNRARDIRVRAELEGMGWQVFVIWECQMRDAAALSRLAKAIAAQPSSGSSPRTASGPGPA